MAKYLLPVKIDRGAGPPVVLLHGLGNNHRSWSFVLKHLSRSVRVIIPDLLGFGDAPKPSLGYSPEDHASAVIATLDSLNIRGALIVGHSMGCIVAVEVAVQRPDLVNQLVLAGAPIYQRQPQGGFLDKLFHTQGLYFSIFTAIKNNPKVTKFAGKVAEDIAPFVKGMEITDETWPAFHASLQHTIMQYKSFCKVTKLKTPTLFLNGIFDFFIIRHTNNQAVRSNPRYMRRKTLLGPHELTPRAGRRIAKIITRLATRVDT